ncbi:MAG: hypothetical protein JNK67_04135 [Alphaproteobacteria bacterium]|nr:hypothetical protein [Alphaproteobacteria bacterium]
MTSAPQSSYEVVFCVPGEAVGAKTPQWFIEGFYAGIDEAQAAAKRLLSATHDRLDTVSIVHVTVDEARGTFKERVVWSKERSLALLSRLNLLPLETETRARIVDHFDRPVAPPPPVASAITALQQIRAPSAVLVGLGSLVSASFCAIGVLVVLA